MTTVKINPNSKKERVIGMFDQKTMTFRKRIQGSKHIFRILDAIGIDAQYFAQVLAPNNCNIRVLDTETMTVYSTTAKEFKDKGQHYHFKKGQDHRAQIFLPREFWKKEHAVFPS